MAELLTPASRHVLGDGGGRHGKPGGWLALADLDAQPVFAEERDFTSAMTRAR